MKKFLFIFLMISFSIASFGQDLSAGLQAKNAGNEAYRNLDYIGAIKSWETYLNSGEEGVAEDTNTKELYNNSFKYAANEFMKNKDYQNAFDYFKKYVELGGDEAKKDGKTAHMMGFCANKTKANDLALSYFQKSIELGYKEDANLLYMADIYSDAGDVEKMKTTLFDAWEKYPESKLKPKMAAMLVVPLTAEASIPFNAGNELAKKASASPTEYLATMGLAVEKFNEAIPLFERVLKYDAKNVNAPTYINACKTNIAAYNEYKASLEKKK